MFNQKKQLYFLCWLLVYYVFVSCQNDKKQLLANQPAVTGHIYEVSLLNYDSLQLLHCLPPTYLILETQNHSNQPIVLCDPRLKNKRECGNEYDISFYKRSYNEEMKGYGYVSQCCLYPIIIPPKSSKKDTISIGVLPANQNSQQRNVSNYAHNDKQILYIPHKGYFPYYQDTIFYPFTNNTKYVERKGWFYPVGQNDCL